MKRWKSVALSTPGILALSGIVTGLAALAMRDTVGLNLYGRSDNLSAAIGNISDWPGWVLRNPYGNYLFAYICVVAAIWLAAKKFRTAFYSEPGSIHYSLIHWAIISLVFGGFWALKENWYIGIEGIVICFFGGLILTIICRKTFQLVKNSYQRLRYRYYHR